MHHPISNFARRTVSTLALFYLSVCFVFSIPSVSAQGVRIVNEVASDSDAKTNRSRGLKMLEEIKEVIEKHYYDKTFRGIDIDERFKIASERVKKLDANWQIFRVIAQVLLDFNDSHTRFFPPGRSLKVEYGITVQMIGGDCYVVDVKRDSDAAAKGVEVGDVVLKINGYEPTKTNLSTIIYLIYALHPQPKLIMSDGKRLEDVGVIPDKPVGPTPSALKQRDDATLAYAASLFGTALTPEQARQFRFITYRDEDEDVKKDEVAEAN